MGFVMTNPTTQNCFPSRSDQKRIEFFPRSADHLTGARSGQIVNSIERSYLEAQTKRLRTEEAGPTTLNLSLSLGVPPLHLHTGQGGKVGLEWRASACELFTLIANCLRAHVLD